MADQMPAPPGPNATPDEIVAWEKAMRAYNEAHPNWQPSAFQQPSLLFNNPISDWFHKNVGAPGSSGQRGGNTSPDLLQTYEPGGANFTGPTAPANKPLQNALRAQAVTAPKQIDVPQLQLDKPPADVVGLNPGTRGLVGDPSRTLTNLLMPKAELTDSAAPDYSTTGPVNDLSSYEPGGSDFTGPMNFTGPQQPSSGNAFTNALGNMSTQDWLGIAGLGLGSIAAFKNASQQNDQFNRQFGLEQSIAGLNATQLNPYKQANDLYSTAVRRALAHSGPAQAMPGTAVPYDPARGEVSAAADQYLSDSALANAKADFDRKAGAVSGQTSLNGDNDLLNGVDLSQKQDDGDGFWHQLAHWGLVAAPFIAAPFTGGASLAAIGAGAGAADAALEGGGWKGALLGAGLGATAGLGGGLQEGAARPSLGAGLRTVGTQALHNKALMSRAVLAALTHR